MTRYTIERASGHTDNKISPCEEAIRGEHLQQIHDHSPVEIHTINYQVWYVDIDTLEDLMRFVDKYDMLVIGKTTIPFLDGDTLPYPSIIIYDGCIE